MYQLQPSHATLHNRGKECTLHALRGTLDLRESTLCVLRSTLHFRKSTLHELRGTLDLREITLPMLRGTLDLSSMSLQNLGRNLKTKETGGQMLENIWVFSPIGEESQPRLIPVVGSIQTGLVPVEGESDLKS